MSNIDSEIDRYAELYRSGRTGWQLGEVNPSLLRHVHLLPENKPDSPPKWICVPLCGKSRDIPYLLNRGYRVFGMEAVESAILELGAENGLTLEYNEEEGIYTTPDGNLVIFLGDIFKCPIEKWGPFDGVWDRASLSIFLESLTSDYVQVIRRGLGHNPDFRYLLEVYDYDKTLSQKPPRAVTEDDMKALFGSWTRIKLINSQPASAKFLEHHSHLQQTKVNQNTYLLSVMG